MLKIKRKEGNENEKSINNLLTKAETKLGFAVVMLPAFMCTNVNAAKATANSIVNNALNQILSLVSLVGIILAVWGLIQFFMAVKNEDSDSKQRAGLTIVAGAGLFGITLFVNNLGLGMTFK